MVSWTVAFEFAACCIERFSARRAAFDQHVEVNRTALISAKAIVERVAESCQTHVLTAARVATI